MKATASGGDHGVPRKERAVGAFHGTILTQAGRATPGRMLRMTDDDFRDIALALDGAIEGAHMGHPDFRANSRIFASLRADRHASAW